MIGPAPSAGVAGPLEERDGYVSFRLAGQWLGVPVALVQEVLIEQPISPVPLAPPAVAGFLNLRGQVVTAVDLRVRLGLAPRPADAGPMNIVICHEDELFSLLVDEVGDVVEVAAAQLEPTPASLDARWLECCAGVVRLRKGLLAVLSVPAVLELGPR